MWIGDLNPSVFANELEVAADKDKHADVDAGGLAVDGGNGVVALL